MRASIAMERKAVCMGYVCTPENSKQNGVMDGGREKSTGVVTHQLVGSYEIEIDGKLWPAHLHMTAPYDPKSKE